MTAPTNDGFRWDARFKRIVTTVDETLRVKDPFGLSSDENQCYQLLIGEKEVAKCYLGNNARLTVIEPSFSETARQILEIYNSSDGKTRFILTSFTQQGEISTPYGSLYVLPDIVNGYNLREGASVPCILEKENDLFYVSYEGYDGYFSPETVSAEIHQHAFNDFLDGLIKTCVYLKENPNNQLFKREQPQHTVNGLQYLRDMLIDWPL